MPMPTWSLTVWKMIFGFVLMVLIIILAGVIAIGHVTQEGSYGLQDLLGGLLVMAGGWTHWAFSSKETGSEKS